MKTEATFTDCTDEEILVIAERIKHKRRIAGVYLDALTKLDQLHRDTSTGGDKERIGSIDIFFRTLRIADKHQDRFDLELPAEAGDEIIAFLLNLTKQRS